MMQQRPTLELPDVPVRGKTGKRDNVHNVLAIIGALLPPGQILDTLIQHDRGCPCTDGYKTMAFCTCEHVNLRLTTIEDAKDIKL